MKKVVIGVIIVAVVIVGILVVVNMSKDSNDNNVVPVNNISNNTNTTNQTNTPTNTVNLSNVETAIDGIKSKQDPQYTVYMNMMKIDDPELLKSTYGIDVNLLEEYLIKVPMMNVKSSLYMVLKPIDGKTADVKAQVDQYMKNYEQQWSTYLPDQHELVKNRQYKEINGYLVYVISSEADTVMAEMENQLK